MSLKRDATELILCDKCCKWMPTCLVRCSVWELANAGTQPDTRGPILGDPASGLRGRVRPRRPVWRRPTIWRRRLGGAPQGRICMFVPRDGADTSVWGSKYRAGLGRLLLCCLLFFRAATHTILIGGNVRASPEVGTQLARLPRNRPGTPKIHARFGQYCARMRLVIYFGGCQAPGQKQRQLISLWRDLT